MIEPYDSALDAIPGSHPYPRGSRYHDAGIGTYCFPDGTEVRYAKRRLLPPLPEDDRSGTGAPGDGDTATHTVSAGERPDQLAQRYFGDPGQWWRIADANPVLDPRELTAEPGQEIAIPLPGAFTTPGSGAPGSGSAGGGGRG
ncbi:LysM peptidoglycan-binding domain-containing protein [Streptomyces sp. WAC 00631]|uniref:LysM peptidoglycan-binding domain-containing protein n=1 Tax=Streptomyces sp. WAC 00631 TaxID=2203201 RepID=UPI000F774AEE|nr:LysM domain-containing protein [Streptomyces sp. WAC 00631]MCC5031709.1 LysM peptidoglycan-binding domain-containing protein [Streptomyces sp. WAC 00631]